MADGLCIKKIDSIYHVCTDEWKRPFFSPRLKDGIVFILDGVNSYTFSMGTVSARKNNILILPANTPYSGVPLSEGVFEAIVIDLECFGDTTVDKIGLPYVMSVSDNEYFESLFREILNCWYNKQLDSDLHIKSLLYELIYKLLKENNDTQNEKTSMLIEYINKNLGDNGLSVSKICQEFYISEATLVRNIKRTTGYSPNVYINLQRHEKAKEYILHTDKNIKEIALLCGFASQYYFSNSFKKRYGSSPKNYRIQYLRQNGGNELD